MTPTRMSDSSGRPGADRREPPPIEPPRGCLGGIQHLARFLHNSLARIDRRTPNSIGLSVLVLATLLATACGPIEPARLEARPPYIDPESVAPAQRVVPVTSNDTITLRATPYDPNLQDDPLYSAWVSEAQPLLDEQRPQTGTARINGEKYFEYAEAQLEINDPCGSLFSERNSATIWLYVADRPFRQVGGAENEVTVGPDGFQVSHTWVLSVEPGACAAFQ